MAIFNKIPANFYACKDGTFSSNSGKNACSWHGGILSSDPIEFCANKATAEVFLIPLDQINIRTEWFQNRQQHFSTRSVQNIIQAVKAGNFKWVNLDPITLWENPQDKRLYLLLAIAVQKLFQDLLNYKLKLMEKALIKYQLRL